MIGSKSNWRVFLLAFVFGGVLLVAAQNLALVAGFLGFDPTDGIRLLVKEFAYAFVISAVVGTLVEVHAVRRHEELMEETGKKFLEFSKSVAQNGLINASPVARYCSLDRVVESVLGLSFAREDYSIDLQLRLKGTGVEVDNQIGWTVKNLSRKADTFQYRFQFDRLIRGARREPTRVVYLKLGDKAYDGDALRRFIEIENGEPVCVVAPVELAEGGSAQTMISFIEHRTTTDCAFWAMSMPCKSISLKVSCDDSLDYVVEALHPGEAIGPLGSPKSRFQLWNLEGGLLPGQGILVRWAPRAT